MEAGKFTIADVVMPMPGCRVVYPRGCAADELWKVSAFAANTRTPSVSGYPFFTWQFGVV